MKQDDGSVIIRVGRAWVQFDAADLQQLYAYAADRPTIQMHVMAHLCAIPGADLGSTDTA
jgi:hypothetical protein